MIQELDLVALTRPLPKQSLQAGDVGAVVLVYQGASAYEVEFADAAGQTVALITAAPQDVRPMTAQEILHVRSVEQAT